MPDCATFGELRIMPSHDYSEFMHCLTVHGFSIMTLAYRLFDSNLLIRSTYKLRSDWTEFCWLAIACESCKDFSDVFCAVPNPEVSYTSLNLWLVSARGCKVWRNALLDVIDLCHKVKGRVIFSLFICKLTLKHCHPSLCADRCAAGVLPVCYV